MVTGCCKRRKVSVPCEFLVGVYVHLGDPAAVVGIYYQPQSLSAVSLERAF